MLSEFFRKYPASSKTALILAIPLIGSNLSQSLKHLTDAVMLGWYGIEALAAGVLGATFLTFILIVGNGFSAATIPLVSGAEGARKSWKVRKYIRMGCWLTSIYVCLTLPFVFFAETFFVVLRQDSSVAKFAADYLLYAIWGLFPALALSVFKAFFLALMRPQIILWATLIGALFNVLGNYILIFGNFGFPELGVVGAAISSTLSHSISFVVMLIYIISKSDYSPYGILTKFFKLHQSSLKEIFLLGWPICITLVAEALFFSLAAIMMGWINVVTLAAHGIVIEICAFVFMIYLGISNAGTSLIGGMAGSGRYELIKAAIIVILQLTFVSVLAAVLMFLIFPEWIISFFLKEQTSQSMKVLSIGKQLLVFAALFQLFDALQVVLSGLLRGLKDTKIPMVYSFVGYCLVGLSSSYLLGFTFGLGAVGVYLGFVIGLSFASFLFAIRLTRKVRILLR